MEIAEYLKFIVQGMVTKPEDVEVSQSQDAMGTLLTLKVSKEDMRGLIGKGGDTAKAIRTVVRIAGFIKNARVSMKILEPEVNDLGEIKI